MIIFNIFRIYIIEFQINIKEILINLFNKQLYSFIHLLSNFEKLDKIINKFMYNLYIYLSIY